jgi:SAM-dependent methyltransferase
MSGFDPAWLTLREPADHAARSASVMAALRDHFAGRDQVSVVDLGCGTGSNLRGTAPFLPAGQHWTLVDYDLRLLAAARERLTAWADRATDTATGLTLDKGAMRLTVAFRQADLSAGAAPVLDPAPDLVTAAALFDLISARWIEGFARDLAARHLPFLTVLTYDDRARWTPPHADDAGVLAAFNADMRRDKGFGPAAGGAAMGALAAAFAGAGCRVTTGDSPWRLLRPADAALMDELARGIAGAVPGAEAWLAARLTATGCEIGHTDLFAAPLA